MNKFHEFISHYQNNQSLFKKLQESQKFFLGSLSDFQTMASISKLLPSSLPYEQCLFHITDGDHDCDYFVFAEKHTDGPITFDIRAIYGDICVRFKNWFVVDQYNAAASYFGDQETGEIKYVDSSGNFSMPSDEGELAFASMLLKCAMSIEIFSCSNIKTIINEPSAALNKKRIKKGKLPFFSYHTLHITGEYSKSDSKGGSHASPRLHLRRGHIRKLATGQKVWVTQCLVGDKSKGFVGKDYIVSMA